MGQRGVCVAEGNGGDVHVGGLLDGLVVCSWVSHDQKPGLLILLLDLIGEGPCSDTVIDTSALFIGTLCVTNDLIACKDINSDRQLCSSFVAIDNE